jgi:mannose-6-phosphate isomerase-like protein (cupin superfamily)
MIPFATTTLPESPRVRAPDGSDVRVLLGLPGGGMARFALEPGQVARAVRHRTVDEIWLVLEGRGAMWRSQAGRGEIVALAPGTCVTIPLGTEFQFRADDDAPLAAVAITMPPWPGEDEAVVVQGPWIPTL